MLRFILSVLLLTLSLLWVILSVLLIALSLLAVPLSLLRLTLSLLAVPLLLLRLTLLLLVIPLSLLRLTLSLLVIPLSLLRLTLSLLSVPLTLLQLTLSLLAFTGHFRYLLAQIIGGSNPPYDLSSPFIQRGIEGDSLTSFKNDINSRFPDVRTGRLYTDPRSLWSLISPSPFRRAQDRLNPLPSRERKSSRPLGERVRVRGTV